ncbi:MAG: hypothetical protein ACRDT6_14805 [Micromonosporaceae bacterium]
MYVRLSSDRTAHPVGVSDVGVDLAGTLLRAPLCEIAAVDRTTGLVRDPHIFVEVDSELVAEVSAARLVLVPDDRVVALLVHQDSGRAVLVGPFASPTMARGWWDPATNVLAGSGGLRFIEFPLRPVDGVTNG